MELGPLEHFRNRQIRSTLGHDLVRDGVCVGMRPKIVHLTASCPLHDGHVTAHPVDDWT